MIGRENSEVLLAERRPDFTTTHWSVVLEARDGSEGGSIAALERLCRAYWYPLYAFVRRQGRSPEDAKDLTQEFFARLIERDFLNSVERTKGKFRTFLLAAMEHFLAKEWNRAHRKKRGGGVPHVSLDVADAEGRYLLEPAETVTPEKVYARRWALTVLDGAMARLRSDYEASGKGALFGELKSVLTGDSEARYAAIAQRLSMSEGAIKVAVHRLRERYGELLREEVANTVSHPDEVEDEIRNLFAALRN